MKDSAYYYRIYTVLVLFGKASETERDSFIHDHTDEKYPRQEWRFCGTLGIGGKYRSETNTVDCYREDETPDRLKAIEKINAALATVPESESLEEQKVRQIAAHIAEELNLWGPSKKKNDEIVSDIERVLRIYFKE